MVNHLVNRTNAWPRLYSNLILDVTSCIPIEFVNKDDTCGWIEICISAQKQIKSDYRATIGEIQKYEFLLYFMPFDPQTILVIT